MSALSAELPGAALAAATARAAAVAPTEGKIPIVIVRHVLLRAGPEGIEFAATNLDQSITVTAAGRGNGAVAAPAAQLAAAAARLDPDAPVVLSATEHNLTISQGRTQYRLPVLPAADFPAHITEPLPDGAAWEPPAERFAAALKALEGAINPNDARFFLVGAMLDLDDDAPAMVTTNGTAMGVVALSDLAPPRRPGLIVPLQAFAPIAAIAKDAERLALSLSDSAITAAAGATRLHSKLVTGTYPAWRRVVPAPPPTRIAVEAARLATLLARVGIIDGDIIDVGKSKKRGPSTVVLTLGTDEITARAGNRDGEEATDACTARRVAGAEATVRVQTRLLTWAAASLAGADTLEIGADPATGPITVTRAGDAERRDLRIIMPMRL